MRVAANGHVYRSPSEWSAIIARYQASGLSAREFCQKEKLVKTSLERWIKRLQADERKARFIEVPSAPAKEDRPWDLEIRLPNGIFLNFRG